jgi:hypothetical protein
MDAELERDPMLDTWEGEGFRSVYVIPNELGSAHVWNGGEAIVGPEWPLTEWLLSRLKGDPRGFGVFLREEYVSMADMAWARRAVSEAAGLCDEQGVDHTLITEHAGDETL